jgi:hypothetical protein
VLAALSQIDHDGVPTKYQSRGVELRHGDKAYPPKHVISVAFRIATGRELPKNKFITTEAERRLLELGFSVIRALRVEKPESKALDELAHELLYSARLYQWSELKHSPHFPPSSPGIYGWFFKRVPPGVPTASCVVREGAILLYVGISPNSEASEGTLRKRLRIHFEGNAEFSTLRQTLGCLLQGELEITLNLDSSGRKTFGEKENMLNEWMAANCVIAWITTPEPWLLEDHLLKTRGRILPLNIESNAGNPFCERLKELREKALERAKELRRADFQLVDRLGSLELDQEVRRPAEEAFRLVEMSPEASIRAARATLVAVVRKMGARDDVPNFLDQAIRDLENGRKVSEATANEMRTIQRIRNAVEYRNATVTSDNARTCAFALLAILKALSPAAATAARFKNAPI